MQRLMIALIGAALAARVAVAEEARENRVPKTFDGTNESFKEGGRELGEGFRGIGRGIKKTFTGKEAREEYQEAEKIGEGFKDIGLGVAGGGRAVGRSVKKGVDANEAQGEGAEPGDAPVAGDAPPAHSDAAPAHSDAPLIEEPLP